MLQVTSFAADTDYAIPNMSSKHSP